MKATIFEINISDGKKSYINQVSSDDRSLVSIYAQRSLYAHAGSIAERLEWDRWEIHYRNEFHKSIPKCVNAVLIGYQTTYSRTKTETSIFQCYFQIEYPEVKK